MPRSGSGSSYAGAGALGAPAAEASEMVPVPAPAAAGAPGGSESAARNGDEGEVEKKRIASWGQRRAGGGSLSAHRVPGVWASWDDARRGSEAVRFRGHTAHHKCEACRSEDAASTTTTTRGTVAPARAARLHPPTSCLRAVPDTHHGHAISAGTDRPVHGDGEDGEKEWGDGLDWRGGVRRGRQKGKGKHGRRAWSRSTAGRVRLDDGRAGGGGQGTGGTGGEKVERAGTRWEGAANRTVRETRRRQDAGAREKAGQDKGESKGDARANLKAWSTQRQ